MLNQFPAAVPFLGDRQFVAQIENVPVHAAVLKGFAQAWVPGSGRNKSFDSPATGYVCNVCKYNVLYICMCVCTVPSQSQDSRPCTRGRSREALLYIHMYILYNDVRSGASFFCFSFSPPRRSSMQKRSRSLGVSADPGLETKTPLYEYLGWYLPTLPYST